MVRVYLEFKNKQWHEVEKSNFWIDRPLLNMLKNLKRIQNKEWDGVFVIDGKERGGKSSLGMICGWYLSNRKMTANNFARGLEDAAKKIAELPDKSVIMVDEGSTVFSSKDTMTQSQKKLIKILDVVGQKNLIFIICLPCYFDLNKTIAVRRSLFLLHVYPDADYNRGKYACWGEKDKKKLYMFGKKNFDSYAYPHSNFVGQYFKFEPPFYKKYLEEVKKESLDQVLGNAAQQADPREWRKQVARKLKVIYPKISYQKIGELFDVSQTTAHSWINEEMMANREEIPIKIVKSPDFSPNINNPLIVSTHQG